MNALFETKHTARSSMAYHRHELPYVTIVIEGSYTEVVADRPRSLREWAVIAHGAGEDHADHFTSSTRCVNIELPHDADVRPGRMRLDLESRPLIERVVYAYGGRDLDAFDAAFEKLHSHLARPALEITRPRWLDQAVGLEEWVDAVPLHDLAKRCDIHPTHFSREFQRYLGTTPSVFRRRTRVERASRLLLNTDHSLAYVALACGFTDQSHLNRAFAIELGMSPGQYRRSFTR